MSLSTEGFDLKMLASAASNAVQAITGLDVDSISGLKKMEAGGYEVRVEVVEARHVPNDRDILCSFVAQTDTAGAIVDVARERRYRRGDV